MHDLNKLENLSFYLINSLPVILTFFMALMIFVQNKEVEIERHRIFLYILRTWISTLRHNN